MSVKKSSENRGLNVLQHVYHLVSLAPHANNLVAL